MTEPATVAEILDDERLDEPLERARVDGGLCALSCPHRRQSAGAPWPRCAAFGAALHPSFEAETVDGDPRVERCEQCLVARELFG